MEVENGINYANLLVLHSINIFILNGLYLLNNLVRKPLCIVCYCLLCVYVYVVTYFCPFVHLSFV